MPKYGEIRECDGRVYVGMVGVGDKKYEHWLSIDSFEKRKKRKANYAKKESQIKKRKDWATNNKEKSKEIKKRWAVKNPNYQKEYKQRPEVKNRINEAHKHRIKTDPSYLILIRCRKRLNKLVKKDFGAKNGSKTIEFLGCSTDFLKEYIEGLFLEGMSWENYGYWHIDHIIPCNTFNFEKKEDVYKCFNYKNLRPLFAKDNLSRPKNGSDLHRDGNATNNSSSNLKVMSKYKNRSKK